MSQLPLTVSEARAILAIHSATTIQLDEETHATWQQIVESARERVAQWEGMRQRLRSSEERA